MSAPASPLELYRETLDSLRARDLLGPSLALRQATVELCAWLPSGVDPEQSELGFPELRSHLELCLAHAQPLLDFGGEHGAGEVRWMLASLASLRAESENLPREPLLSLALRDLAWTLLADSLALDRPTALTELAALALPDPYDPAVAPIFGASELRYANAHGGYADRTYLRWREWLLASELIAAIPHLKLPARLSASIDEAELLTALAFAARHGETYCGSLNATGGQRQLRAHLPLPGAAAGFAAAIGVGSDQLTEQLNRLYPMLSGPDRRRPRTPLIAT